MSSQNVRHSFSDPAERRLQATLDVALRHLHTRARQLIGATTHSDPSERQRLVAAVERGEHAKPRWVWRAVPIESALWQELDGARRLATRSVAPELYASRLEELETELLLLESLGKPKQVRPMAARLFGTGSERVFEDEPETLLDAAHEILAANTEVTVERKTIPAASSAGLGLREIMLSYARQVGIHVAVRVDSALIANAAVGERTVFIADRSFGARESRRLATHEVFGHLVSAFNGRAQRLGVFSVGTAGSYGDQEGVAICLEELAGLLDGARKRTIAGRLLATHAMHAGVSFGDTAKALVCEHGFSASEAVTLCERSFRGGGVARDAVYLASWLRVRRAISERETSLRELQLGRVSLRSLPWVRPLQTQGLVGSPVYLSNFARSFGSTGFGTRSEMSPPSRATSLTRLDAT